MFIEFLTQNVIWVAAFVVVANMLVFNLVQGGVRGVNKISALQLPQLQRDGKSVIIDVCESAEYQKRHIPDSVNFPISSLHDKNKDLLKHKENTVILVCQSGNRSSKAAKLLQGLDFSDLHILQGGLMSWNKENLPTTAST